MIDELHLDFETRSEIELDERGLDNYARHPSTQILMMAWAVNDGRVNLWQPHKDGPMPAEAREALEDPFVRKVAWNATFERSILHRCTDLWIPYEEWHDPMVHARYLSMPGSLEDAGHIVKLKQSEGKVVEGKQLIKLFCSAAVDAAESGLFGRMPASFNDWLTHPEAWSRFCDYCKQDVVAERAIAAKLAKYPFPDSEREIWELDQRINDTGMPVDMPLVRGARKVTEIEMARLKAELRELTHLENPNSNDQMLKWVQGQGYPFGALGKPFVARAFAGEGDLTPLGRKALELRALTSKSAVHKFTALSDVVSEDARIRQQFVYYGARTGRFSGREFQPHNAVRPTKEVEKKMDRAIELLQKGDYEAIRAEFTSALDVVTSCSRPAIKAGPGKKLVVSDLGAIENRVLGWLAFCEGILRVFREGLDPYKDFGADLYSKPYDQISKEERNNSKPAVLGCGYQLSGGEEVVNKDGDMIRTGLWGYAKALGVDITQEEAHRSVKVFRDKFPEVVELWRQMEEAAHTAVRTRKEQVVGKLAFQMQGKGLLQMVLPSGRALNYLKPSLDRVEVEGRDGKTYVRTQLSYECVDQGTKQWSRTNTYSGRLVENACQAVARDVLCHGMLKATEVGFTIVGHVHDEIITEVEENSALDEHELERCMTIAPAWASDLVLAAEGFSSNYYKKG